MLETFSLFTLAILVIAVIKIMFSFIIKKKITIINEDQFRDEINKLKHFENQVLFLFENGYWEIKEATVSKEWSQNLGTQTIIDIDPDIDTRRYKKMMGEPLQKDEYGDHGIKILKEIDLSKDHDPEHLLALKI
jgi:hypothetical protein